MESNIPRILASSIPEVSYLFGVFIMDFGSQSLPEYKLPVENSRWFKWA
ncbi:MAG: hypothetical protein IPN67_16580 [Bacteroidales bacterium]|nr:hypothetical protein [Bacteroidales bacterium]